MTESRIPGPSFRSAFLAAADRNQTMAFSRFMELALYEPQLGYYRKNRKRIGFDEGTDFYTATSSSPVFGALIAAACAKLLGANLAREIQFVELGSETPEGIMAGVQHPFASIRTLRVGESIELSGRCVVFSNELFDAQPFRRFIYREKSWSEVGVKLHNDELIHVELPSEPLPELPPHAIEGYVVDVPLAASALTERIAEQPWTGLFLACDYGKRWADLIESYPNGTARSYFRHQQSNDLLARPGEQDITCHICWDWLMDALLKKGFATPNLQSQESFFINHAAEFIAPTIALEASRLSPIKRSLLQLLHPAQLGQKFQVLHAIRHDRIE